MPIEILECEKNKTTQNKPHNLNPRIRIDEGLSYSKFVLPVAFLKPVPAVLIVPEQVNCMTFWPSYHKSQEWKEYRYRTTALLKKFLYTSM